MISDIITPSLLHFRGLRSFAAVGLVAASVLSSACSGHEAHTGDSAAVSTFKVALLTPGSVSDHSWNGGAYDGLLRIRDSLGAQISNIQTATPADFEDNFRQYGAQGYQLVFGHGFEFQDAAKRVAPQFPHTIYVTTSGTTAGPNLAGMTFGFADASYLAGILAASMTKTNKLGALGGTALPPVVESFRAFELGAKSVKPSIKVVTSYIGNWDDVSAGKEQALAQLAQGVDVIFQNADAAGLGVFQAARERKNAWIIGSNSDQNGVAPDVTLGSVVIDLPLAFLTIARQVKNGSFKPGVIELGEASRVVTLVLNPTVAARIPQSTRSTIDSLQARMESAAFHVTVDTSTATKR
jgi:basic membrane lipoprotein Med (substrate-binding protein (PBP1-ABC) superfamily)